jgi:cytochrome c peroxidase
MTLPVLAAPGQDETPQSPLGLPPIFWPDENPFTPQKAELGKLLFFDKRLSSDGTISCATCHAPSMAFTDRAPVSTGLKSQQGGRNAPTVINRAFSTLQFWDGRASSLEDQAKGPLANPIEMTLDDHPDIAHHHVVERLQAVPGYVKRFEQAFGKTDFAIDQVAKAIATFERTVLSANSPYDRYQAGDQNAMTAEQVRGMNIFFKKAACDSCHLGFNFTDGSYMNVGIGMDKPKPDFGRFLVTQKEEDKGAFKTPTLREIEHTFPYMHDGSLKTLEEVVEHYDKGGIPNPNLSPRMKLLHLTGQEKKELVSFLKALSGDGWQQIRPPVVFPK